MVGCTKAHWDCPTTGMDWSSCSARPLRRTRGQVQFGRGGGPTGPAARTRLGSSAGGVAASGYRCMFAEFLGTASTVLHGSKVGGRRGPWRCSCRRESCRPSYSALAADLGVVPEDVPVAGVHRITAIADGGTRSASTVRGSSRDWGIGRQAKNMHASPKRRGPHGRLGLGVKEMLVVARDRACG